MSETTTSTTDDVTVRDRRRAALLMVLLAAMTVGSVVFGLLTGPGIAAGNTPTATPTAAPSTPTPALEDVAPYYAANDTTVDNESFYEGRRNASLENTTNFLTRIGPLIIGSGTAQGGVGDAGILVTGLLFGGILLGTVFGAGVGPVGGLVLGVTTIGGLATVAVLPAWFWPVLLFGLGITLSIVVVRSIR